jgi:hypothetical protein
MMNAPENMATFKPSQLNSRATLVKFTKRQPSLTKRDEEAESMIQDELNDGALIVNRKLFRDPANPVNRIITSMGQAYAYHKRLTFPHIDRGPRIISNTIFMEYRNEIVQRIRDVEAMMVRVMPIYDQCVQDDIRYRTQGPKPPRASVEDYPTASDFKSATSISVLPMPLPDKRHFLFDLPDEEMEAFDAVQDRIERVVKADTVKRMLEPVQHLAKKLAIPIGETGATFRDSSVENIIEAVDLVRRIDVLDDPEIAQVMRELTQTIATYSERMEWLRESPIMRAEAKGKLDDIAKKMAAFM